MAAVRENIPSRRAVKLSAFNDSKRCRKTYKGLNDRIVE